MWPAFVGGGVVRGFSERFQDFFLSPASLYFRIMCIAMCHVCLLFILRAGYLRILVGDVKAFHLGAVSVLSP